jgi:hypothetical protein
MSSKILKGLRPGDLPVEFPTKLELIIKSSYGKSACLDRPGHFVGNRRRGDRMTVPGTKRPIADEPSGSVLEGKADEDFNGPNSRS